MTQQNTEVQQKTNDNAIDIEKSRITKILNLEENQFGKSIITWKNQITKRIKNEWTRTVLFLTWHRNELHVLYNNGNIPDLVHNILRKWWVEPVLWLVKPSRLKQIIVCSTCKSLPLFLLVGV